MVKEHKLHAAVKSSNLNNVLKVLEKYNKQKFRSSSNKCKKIDFEQRDSLGLTVIHHAARNGSIDILETLLVHGSAFDVFDCHGLRPIGYACAEGHIKIVDYLLRWGSCANRLSTVEYLTPLHLSAMYGYVEIVHLLLRYKADPFVLNKDNKTPLDLACAYGKYNVINLLFSFTTSLGNKNKQTNNNFNDSSLYGPRTPQSDQIARCNRMNQSNVPSTPKVERYLNRRSSSPYGSTNSSSGGSGTGNYNTSTSKNRVVRNISSFTDTNCNSPLLSHNNDTRHSARSSATQHCDVTIASTTSTDIPMPSNTDVCVPPTLDCTPGTNDCPNYLRQNLREACFAVQARALMEFGSNCDSFKTISFEIGDLITVLKQYHNGVMKGFVTSEGISSTGLFPSNFVEFINDNRPPVCCDKPVDISIYQSPEKTPIPNRGKSLKDRPSYLDLQENNHRTNNESDPENEEADGSPIIIPPQMTSIRTNTVTTGVKWSMGGNSGGCGGGGGLPRCSCERHPNAGCVKLGVNMQSPDLPSVSINDLTYCLSLGQGLISAVSGSTNKRNSIVSMDSGRGSATDNKSVVSGSTQASVNCNKPPSSPMHCCQITESSDSAQCRCRACTILPPTVPAPYHQITDDQSLQYHSHILSPYRGATSPIDTDFMLPRTGSYSQQVSVDSLYYPCSMISLDDTQYSSGSSDRGAGGADDVMINWLHSVGLGSYSDILSNAGYDLATLTKATPEDLNASGITNPKDRQFMKTQLNRLSVYDGLPETMPSTIHDFLEGLKLLQYEELLSKQNFSKTEHLLGLTWEDLADIGIQKLGHQKKLSLAIERLSRLVQYSNNGNNQNQISPPPSRLNQDAHSKFTPVPQSRSFEELPYPTAIMSDQEPRDSFPKSRYKGLRLLSFKLNNGDRGSGLLSKSDESVSSVTEIPLPNFSAMYGRHDDMSVSSSASSCSQESGQDNNIRLSHNPYPSSASHFAHDNVGTVRIKRPLIPISKDCVTEPS